MLGFVLGVLKNLWSVMCDERSGFCCVCDVGGVFVICVFLVVVFFGNLEEWFEVYEEVVVVFVFLVFVCDYE